jgi:hypothetical protein
MRLTVKVSTRRRLRPVPIIFVIGVSAGLLGLALRMPARALAQNPAYRSVQSSTPFLVQDGDQGDNNEVPAASIGKYVSVYKAMQRDRRLTVEQAAAQEGLTMQEFRNLEGRVERSDTAREQARQELQAAAASPSPTPAALPAKPSNPSSTTR